jgi:Tol biopolymer transport system component
MRRSALLALLVAVALPAPAHAAFPGKNGKIAFNINFQINTINPDGTGQTRLTNGPTYATRATWSPDGTKIAFASGPVGPNSDIYTMNADGTTQTQLTTNPGFDIDPAWSPDGTKISFESRGENRTDMYIMNADGTDQTRLTSVPEGASEVAWSPDGTKIAFVDATTVCDPIPELGCFAQIYTINTDGTGLKRLTTNRPDGAYTKNIEPNWSPDGGKIAFVSDRDDRGVGPYLNPGEIYTMNADGSGLTRLTNSPTILDFSPAWSPDGQKIAFTSFRDGTFQVYTMNTDGSQPTELTNDPFPTDPTRVDWQPLPGPQRGDYKNAAQFCKAERDFMGDAAFTQKYGGGANAHGKCVSQSH